MKNKFGHAVKKVSSLFLALVLLCTMLPISAAAVMSDYVEAYGLAQHTAEQEMTTAPELSFIKPDASVIDADNRLSSRDSVFGVKASYDLQDIMAVIENIAEGNLDGAPERAKSFIQVLAPYAEIAGGFVLQLDLSAGLSCYDLSFTKTAEDMNALLNADLSEVFEATACTEDAGLIEITFEIKPGITGQDLLNIADAKLELSFADILTLKMPDALSAADAQGKAAELGTISAGVAPNEAYFLIDIPQKTISAIETEAGVAENTLVTEIKTAMTNAGLGMFVGAVTGEMNLYTLAKTLYTMLGVTVENELVPYAGVKMTGTSAMADLYLGVLVEYDANGGKNAPTDDKVYAPGSDVTVSSKVPTRDGYTFVSWNTQADGKGDAYAAGASFTIEADTTLYARWKKIPDPTYRVTYRANGGTNAPVDQINYKSGDSAYAKPAGNMKPPAEDMMFTGWNTKADGSGESYMPGGQIVVKGNVTLYAQWKVPGPFTITYNANGGTSAPVDTNNPYTNKSIATVMGAGLMAPPESDMEFLSWNTKPDGTGTTYNPGTPIIMVQDVLLYAQWSKIPVLEHNDHYVYLFGYPNGTIGPKRNITREETAAVFFRLMSETSRNTYFSLTHDFPDAAATRWSNREISTLTNAGIISGDKEGTFRPESSITRAEFATMAAKFDSRTPGTVEVQLSDISGHWAEGYIKKAAALGWIKGYEDGTFRPNQPISRAEVTAFINNILGRSVTSTEDLLSDMRTFTDNMDTNTWYYYHMQEAANSHEYTRKSGNDEKWTKLTADPEWYDSGWRPAGWKGE